MITCFLRFLDNFAFLLMQRNGTRRNNFSFFFMHNTLSCLKVLVRFIHYSVVSFLLPASLRVSDSLQNQGKLGMKSNFNEITTNFLESSLLTENCMNFENFRGRNEITFVNRYKSFTKRHLANNPNLPLKKQKAPKNCG